MSGIGPVVPVVNDQGEIPVVYYHKEERTEYTLRPPRPMPPVVLVKDRWVPERLARLIREFDPKSEMGKFVREILHYLPAEQAAELVARVSRSVVMESSLALRVFRANPDPDVPIWIEDLGIVSNKVVTTVGVGFIVDAFQNLTELENMKFHGIGTGGTAEAVGDTALVTELTTQYNPDSTRATGTTTENAANVYRTVGTNTVDAAVAITEHGIFTQAATGGGTLLDRSLFSAVNLASGDSIQSTYDLTVNAGG